MNYDPKVMNLVTRTEDKALRVYGVFVMVHPVEEVCATKDLNLFRVTTTMLIGPTANDDLVSAIYQVVLVNRPVGLVIQVCLSVVSATEVYIFSV